MTSHLQSYLATAFGLASLVALAAFGLACSDTSGSQSTSNPSESADFSDAELEACWSYSVDDCESEGGEACTLIDGWRDGGDRECMVQEPAYCMPAGRSCNGEIVSLESPDGLCWDIGGDCGRPDGWTRRDEQCVAEENQDTLCPESQPEPPADPECVGESCGQPCLSVLNCSGDANMVCTPVGADDGKICAAAWYGCGGGGASTSQEHCEWNINCNHGVDYTLDCRRDGDTYACDCIVDGQTTHQFQTEESTCPPITHKQMDRVNENCEWKMYGRE
jgi:hypothetical protein